MRFKAAQIISSVLDGHVKIIALLSHEAGRGDAR